VQGEAPSSISLPSSNGSSSPPARKVPSAASMFLNAAKQKAVDGVRHLLDSEAQPDRCPDPMWVMGVAHPGWRPETPESSFANRSLDPTEVLSDPPSAQSSNRPSPISKPDSGLRSAGWPRRMKEDPNSAMTSPRKSKAPSNDSNTSLALPDSVASPVRESLKVPPAVDSPLNGKKPRGEKEVLAWPGECKQGCPFCGPELS